MRELLADPGEDDEREAEADRGGEGEEHCLEEARALLAVDLRSAEDGAVRGDEREEYAERRVERGKEAPIQRGLVDHNVEQYITAQDVDQALANTPTGRMKQLSNTLGDIKEKFGEWISAVFDGGAR